MQAVRYSRYGGPEVLEVVEVDAPQAGPNQVRIAVHAAGAHPVDWKLRDGFFSGGKPLAAPAGVGIDAAGVVDQVGEGVTDVAVGDSVFGSGSGTFAEYAVLTAWARMPQQLAFDEAAATPGVAETSMRMLQVVGAKAGDTIVISGAAGGVGTALTQIARAAGMTVIGTASAANQAYIESLGAIPTTYEDGWVERVRGLAENGVQIALDVAGRGVIPQLIELTGDPSKVLSISDFTAPQHGAKLTTGSGDVRGALHHASHLFEQGALHVPVERVFTLHEVAEAQKHSKAGHGRGRTVIKVRDFHRR